MLTLGSIRVNIRPRETVSRVEFFNLLPRGTVTLDGMMAESPFFDEKTLRANFDHHSGCERAATMSTAMQVMFAIKGGLVERFVRETGAVNVYINDTDQDTSLAVWLLANHKLFEGASSLPSINRLLDLNNKWDITGGAYPMNLNDALVRQHCWVFEPYTNLRKSGALATANEAIMEDNLVAVLNRLDKFMLGQALEKELDTRHEILYDGGLYKIVDEIGGNEARYHLYSKGMKAFVSRVATRTDGNFVYSIGRCSPYVKFPVLDLMRVLSDKDHADWGGSGLIGGSNRKSGSCLDWPAIRDIINKELT